MNENQNKRVIIEPKENGYVISYHHGGEQRQWVARSWVEVLELLKERKAPDFVGESES